MARAKYTPKMIWAIEVWFLFLTAVVASITHFKVLTIVNRPGLPILTNILFICGLVFIPANFYNTRFIVKRTRNHYWTYVGNSGFFLLAIIGLLGGLMRMSPWQVYLLIGLSFCSQIMNLFQVASSLKQEFGDSE